MTVEEINTAIGNALQYDDYRCQKENGIKIIESFSAEAEVYSLPRVLRYIPLGKTTLTHDRENGFILKGHYRNKDYYIHRPPQQTSSLHVEYDFGPLKKRDFVDISTENNSFYCCPTKQNIITKLAFATEEIYLRSQKQSTSADE